MVGTVSRICGDGIGTNGEGSGSPACSSATSIGRSVVFLVVAILEGVVPWRGAAVTAPPRPLALTDPLPLVAAVVLLLAGVAELFVFSGCSVRGFSLAIL